MWSWPPGTMRRRPRVGADWYRERARRYPAVAAAASLCAPGRSVIWRRRRSLHLIPALSRPFLRLGCVPIDLFPNNSFRRFVEVGVQGRLQLKVFRPKRVVEKGPRRANHHCGVTLTLIAIRFEPVSPAKRRKEASLPLVRHGNLRLGQRLRLDRRVERLADPLYRGRRSLTFARGRGTLE